MTRRILTVALGLGLLGQPALADWVTLPAGTVVYGETQERVTSRRKETSEGDLVQAIVWRDVQLKGETVIEAGTPIVLKVSKVKKAKVAGIKGKLELRAFSTTAVDGTQVPLVGGYDKSGRGKKALAISLAAVVFVPLIFIKGKHAILEPGTVFDAQIQGNTDMQLEAKPRRVIKLDADETLVAEILYDEIPEEGKLKALPIRLVLCGETGESAAVVAVNEEAVPPITIELSSRAVEGDCITGGGEVSLEELGEHFVPGINTFDVEFGNQTVQVIMEVEL